jgi:peptidoglycan/LPS O-acetylase OafA/YrhL
MALLASIFECYIFLSLGLPESFASSQIKISSFLYSLAILNLHFVIRKYSVLPLHKGLVYMGDYSYGIFYIHIFILMIVYKITFYIPYIQNVLPINQLVQLTLSIILSVFFINIIKKIFGDKAANNLLGI